MKRFLFILIIVFVVFELNCFEPKGENFANTYQFELYNSWLEKGDFKTNFPAGFTQQKIVKTFENKSKQKILVEYDLSKMKIINQREVLPFVFILENNFEIKPYLHYLESFIYRLNSSNKKYLYDFIDLKQIELEYSAYKNKNALDVLWKNYSKTRIIVEPIELDIKDDKLGFIIPTSKGKTIKLYLKTDIDIADMVEQIEILEASKSTITKVREEKKRQQIKQKIVEEIKMEEINFEKLSLAEFIDDFHNKPPHRELLHNKISDPAAFLKNEFPQHKLKRVGNKFLLSRKQWEKELHSDIRVELIEREDGIEFKPSIDHVLSQNKLILNDSEQIDLSSLSETEREIIAGFLPHLIYEHRTLGSKLLNFMIIHDGVPTTLVVKNSKREIYEMESYADLLLLLGNYWQDRLIFFSITEVKKKSGMIEMKGFLIAENEQKQDLAEVMFFVNKENNIDLIMMILHTKN